MNSERLSLSPLDINVLNALKCFSTPVAAATLLHVSSLIGVTLHQVEECLPLLESDGLVEENEDYNTWLLTARGRNALIEPEPAVSATVCNAGDAPATALVCLDEDELDEWWEDQDVEVKADAFLRWALNRGECYIHIPETTRIPILGTVGAGAVRRGDPSSEDIDRMAEEQRIAEQTRGANSQPDGYAE